VKRRHTNARAADGVAAALFAKIMNMTYWAHLRKFDWPGLDWEIGPVFNRRWTNYLRSRLAEIEAALMHASSPGSPAYPDWQAPRHDPAPCDIG